jgi:hypothetical protein
MRTSPKELVLENYPKKEVVHGKATSSFQPGVPLTRVDTYEYVKNEFRKSVSLRRRNLICPAKH